ncbi:hypothetical protein LOSG293_210360 [Secundilactobacillus oryzae JCM 18671]|uniref:Uncharacterized protein n=1 Tax=Secundilactobacillus oryzae JCM 18671 TaxID=1291743 RepID=A0A081BJJ4_9LACO|nr:hypothetical protein LOSG293_210360 [Secundilactobacillus oryzae JCM 18671]
MANAVNAKLKIKNTACQNYRAPCPRAVKSEKKLKNTSMNPMIAINNIMMKSPKT